MKRILIYRRWLILFQLIFFSRICIGQTSSKLHISLQNLGSQSEFLFKNKKVQPIMTVSSRYFAPNNNSLKIDYSLFSNYLNKLFPDPNSNNIAVLDWEGNVRTDLLKNPNSSEFKEALSSSIELIKYAKKLRPNVKWGFFALPFTAYYGRNQFDQTNLNILPLLKESDILFPCFYIYFKDKSVDTGGNIAFAQDNIKKCLKLAEMAKIKVMPYVWHRYYDVNNSPIGLDLIPINDFANFIKAILNTSYLGQKAAGVVWWGADQYFYNVKKLPLVNEYKKSGMKNFKDYHDKLIVDYGTQILKTINGN